MNAILRENSAAGGLLITVHKPLKPASVSNDYEREVLGVEVTIASKKVRFINSYGPQKDEIKDIRECFFQKSSKLAGALVCQIRPRNCQG